MTHKRSIIMKNNPKFVNRTLDKNIAVVLLLVLFISSYAIPSYAELDRGVGDKTILEHHFEMAGIDGLVNDHLVSPNTDGSCGYVAMSMLLSYYDTYWNYRFVPENLEWDEGRYDPELEMIIRTFNAESENNTFNTKKTANNQYSFTDFVNEYNGTYLQPYLINMDRYENPLLLIPGLFAVLDDTMVSSLRRYLYDERNFNENEVIVHIMRETETSDTALYNKMKEQIALGNPVIYYGSKSVNEIDITSAADWAKVGGHYMIAYDVCTNNGIEDIKLNLGWNMPEGNTNVMLSDCEYTNFNSIIWLEINKTVLGHEHDTNYYNVDSEEYICSCQIYSTHSAHNFNHISVDSNDGCYNSTHHWNNACHCGEPGPDSIISLHNLTYSYHTSLQHYEICSECGYTAEANHEYTIPYSSTNTSHSLKCACGATTTEAHYAYRFGPLDNSLHTVYCKCGKEWTEPHVVESGSYTGNNKYALCLACGRLVTVGMTLHPTMNDLPRSENGSFILPDGVIVLVDEDIEAYFAGTLEFNYPDDNLETE